MKYEDMNIYDKASILQNMLFDDELMFFLTFNDKEFNLSKMNVGENYIELLIDQPYVKIVDDKPANARCGMNENSATLKDLANAK